jgi:putative oxidoreductase
MERTRYLPAIGRVLMGLPFLMSGAGKLASYGATAAYIASVGLPLAPLGWVIAILLEIGGGLCLLLGFRVRPVAVVLSLFTLATAVFFHHNFADQNQMIHFLKDVVIAGGFMQIAHFGAGAYSLDGRRSRNQDSRVGAIS